VFAKENISHSIDLGSVKNRALDFAVSDLRPI